MPPIRTESSQKLVNQEGKILLALDDIKNSCIKSIRAATGFAMDFILSQKVVIQVEYYSRRSILQPDNCEWITVIETIYTDGYSLLFCIIFKDQIYIAG
ncbi:uncharacterized protein N7469_000582 [Penicillium citrinum]|uniref:Uncharacterized protein n=1 Tax=Penicillium citrinum TaxID=5077 RepID=A0A9W9PCW7_PENCI|nr:uncharacterized protein N7469_000582 [Penicillium citrinum]KAJ5242255.1 hypothetical protein N7469_000582 [Penicillium citrinum]